MPLHLSACLQRTDIVFRMDNPEAALHPQMNELSFYTAVDETQSDMPQPSWETVLSQEAALAPGTLSNAQGDGVSNNPRRDIEDRLEKRRIGDIAKAAVKQLVQDELAMLVEEFLYEIFRTLYHEAQTGVRPVVHNVVEQILFEKCRKHALCETLEAHISEIR